MATAEAAAFSVRTRTTCPHLAAAVSPSPPPTLGIPPGYEPAAATATAAGGAGTATDVATVPAGRDYPCARLDCGCDTANAWICCACWRSGCGRDDEGHAMVHAAEAEHPVVLCPADGSVFCYGCDAYLNVFHLPPLHPAFRVLHRNMHGTEASLPAAAGGRR